MISKKVALLASFNPSWFDRRLLEVLIIEDYQVILPTSEKGDENNLTKGLDASQLEQVHLFRCDFANLEDTQLFQTYIFEQFYPIDLVLSNFQEPFEEKTISDLTNEDLSELVNKGFMIPFNFSKCVQPILNSKNSKILIYSVVKEGENLRNDFGSQITKSWNSILTSCLKRENQNSNLQIETVEVVETFNPGGIDSATISNPEVEIVFEKIIGYVETGTTLKNTYLIPTLNFQA